jgi:hypothetical protein
MTVFMTFLSGWVACDRSLIFFVVLVVLVVLVMVQGGCFVCQR